MSWKGDAMADDGNEIVALAGLLFFFAFARAHPEVIKIIRFEIASFVVITLAAIPLNMKMAKKYQRQIDDLDRQRSILSSSALDR